MNDDNKFMNRVLGFILELLDIPSSHYKQAVERYQSLGDWFHRKESKLAAFSPEVYVQGSFRYGTVVRPLVPTDPYDLDLICQIVLTKGAVTQKRLKELLGYEIKAYAKAHSFRDPVEEKNRCWRLNYSDGVSFHMDAIPCLAEDISVIQSLQKLGVPSQLAASAIAITDIRHPDYSVLSSNWPSSNPRGVATWFEDRMREIARDRVAKLVENRLYASIDDVPSYEWKTPLQLAIQILKRHRDVMFKNEPERRPLSMIITTLATHAYNGETDLYEALNHIVDGMPKFIRPAAPRIPNPVNPAEDFADRWASDPSHELNFRLWHLQLKADIAELRRGSVKLNEVDTAVRKKFDLGLTSNMKKDLETIGVAAAPMIITSSQTTHIISAPKPWAP